MDIAFTPNASKSQPRSIMVSLSRPLREACVRYLEALQNRAAAARKRNGHHIIIIARVITDLQVCHSFAYYTKKCADIMCPHCRLPDIAALHAACIMVLVRDGYLAEHNFRT